MNQIKAMSLQDEVIIINQMLILERGLAKLTRIKKCNTKVLRDNHSIKDSNNTYCKIIRNPDSSPL